MLVLLSIAACGQIIANAKQEFAEDLSATIMEFDDPETIKKGVPTYLILISSMIKGDPDNPSGSTGIRCTVVWCLCFRLYR